MTEVAMPSSAARTFTDPDASHVAIRDAHAEGVITARQVLRQVNGDPARSVVPSTMRVADPVLRNRVLSE
jgi:hypothetical protein